MNRPAITSLTVLAVATLVAASPALLRRLKSDAPPQYGDPVQVEQTSAIGAQYGLVRLGGGFTIRAYTGEGGEIADAAWIAWGKLLPAPKDDPVFGDVWIEPTYAVEPLPLDSDGWIRAQWIADDPERVGKTYNAQFLFRRKPDEAGVVRWGVGPPITIEVGP